MNKEKINQIVAGMASFLLDDHGSELETPLKEYLEIEKLDYSLDSLNIVDQYLEKVKENRAELSDDQYTKVILRCGAYCGEIIKKQSTCSYEWTDYDSAVLTNPKISEFGKSPLTHWILIDKQSSEIIFPMNKVYKFLENGTEDSLYFFAQVHIQK